MTTLYARQQKTHRCKEQAFSPCGRRRGWDDLRESTEARLSLYIKSMTRAGPMCEACRALKAGALGEPGGMGWGGAGVGDSGLGDTRAPVADSCQCVAKTSTVLQSN